MKGRWNKTFNNRRQINKGEKGGKENIGGKNIEEGRSVEGKTERGKRGNLVRQNTGSFGKRARKLN